MKINQERVDNIVYDLERKYLSWFLKDYKIFGGENLEKLKGKKIFYLPNHLSHMDYIVIPFIINKHKLPHPSIVAGKNLDQWPTKKLFCEETGAVFVDRKKIENGNTKTKKEEIMKLKKSVEDIVYSEHDLLVFLDGTRKEFQKIMESPKDRYPREYLYEILKQEKNTDDYFGLNIAINYKPSTIEGPFFKMVRFFKGKSFPLYFGLDIFAFLTQPIRKKPLVYVNFGEPYPLKKFIEKQDSRGLVQFVKEDVKRLFKEID